MIGVIPSVPFATRLRFYKEIGFYILDIAKHSYSYNQLHNSHQQAIDEAHPKLVQTYLEAMAQDKELRNAPGCSSLFIKHLHKAKLKNKEDVLIDQFIANASAGMGDSAYDILSYHSKSSGAWPKQPEKRRKYLELVKKYLPNMNDQERADMCVALINHASDGDLSKQNRYDLLAQAVQQISLVTDEMQQLKIAQNLSTKVYDWQDPQTDLKERNLLLTNSNQWPQSVQTMLVPTLSQLVNRAQSHLFQKKINQSETQKQVQAVSCVFNLIKQQPAGALQLQPFKDIINAIYDHRTIEKCPQLIYQLWKCEAGQSLNDLEKSSFLSIVLLRNKDIVDQPTRMRNVMLGL